jgi:hypothetical protein
MNISGILLHGSIRNVILVCKDHYFPVSRVDFVGVVIGRLINYQRYLIISSKIYSHNSKSLKSKALAGSWLSLSPIISLITLYHPTK